MATTPTKPEAAKAQKTKAEKEQILREAVSYYLRNDFRAADIREVCEEFVAGVDKEARAAGESGSTAAHHSPPKKS